MHHGVFFDCDMRERGSIRGDPTYYKPQDAFSQLVQVEPSNKKRLTFTNDGLVNLCGLKRSLVPIASICIDNPLGRCRRAHGKNWLISCVERAWM